MEGIPGTNTHIAASEGGVADRGHYVVGRACKFGDGDVGELGARVAVESGRHVDDIGDGWLSTVIAPVEDHGVTGIVGASCGQSTVDVGMNRGDGEEEGEERGEDEPRGRVGVSHRTKVIPHRRQKYKIAVQVQGVRSEVVSGTSFFGGRDILSKRSRLTLKRRKLLLLAGEVPGELQEGRTR